ncbi:hypothetical protein EDD16DRAFT_1472665 [Pisolithus croceorrhizus]|nr:hypothetical protein EDD16DRAFT_1472665 [Pisolithus croceorrhizus]KAI6165198.1 hypothetical protein EDD17DRAFT_1473314 [Pisolithus thermaeus]
MALPANDAFSLGLAHDQPRRSSSRSRTPSLPRRSSTPPTNISMAGAKRAHKLRASSMRDSHYSSASMGSLSDAPTLDELVEEVDAQVVPREAKKQSRARNGSASSTSRHRKHPEKKDNKIDFEIPRKALHSSIGFLTLYLWTSDGSRDHVVMALSSALAVLIPVDILRLRYPSFERAFEKCVGIFMRDSERRTSNGVIWYMIGVNTVLVTLPLDIAVVSVAILSWADTAASTFGRLYGQFTPRLPARLPILGLPLASRKSLAGFIAAAITGAAVAVGFWSFVAPLREQSSELSWTWEGGVGGTFADSGSKMFSGWTGIATIGIVTGLVTAVAEALDLGSVDDNLSLPIITGGCLWGLFKVLGWLGGVFS